MRRKLAAGNWKMNGVQASLAEIEKLAAAHPDPAVDVLICPPATLLASATATVAERALLIGAQDCHAKEAGAHTGDVSAEMLKDAGARYVILGHSERRTDYRELSEDVRVKARTAMENDLTAIVCIGESLFQREATNTLDIIGAQLSLSVPDGSDGDNLVIAYEPVWAIGSGLTPTPDQIGEVHDFIRDRLELRFGKEIGQAIRLLYGGSVKPTNAGEIFAISNVDGALVGGASLTAADFSPIIHALEHA